MTMTITITITINKILPKPKIAKQKLESNITFNN